MDIVRLKMSACFGLKFGDWDLMLLYQKYYKWRNLHPSVLRPRI